MVLAALPPDTAHNFLLQDVDGLIGVACDRGLLERVKDAESGEDVVVLLTDHKPESISATGCTWTSNDEGAVSPPSPPRPSRQHYSPRASPDSVGQLIRCIKRAQSAAANLKVNKAAAAAAAAAAGTTGAAETGAAAAPGDGAPDDQAEATDTFEDNVDSSTVRMRPRSTRRCQAVSCHLPRGWSNKKGLMAHRPPRLPR